MTHPRILVIHRRSPYTDFVSENGHPHIKKLIESGNRLVAGLVAAHDNHTASMSRVAEALERRGIEATWRHNIGRINPDAYDLVVTVGGDGTVLHASHAIERTAVLAVNSAPTTSVGFFTCTDAHGFGARLDEVLQGGMKPMRLSRMVVRVNDEIVTDRALNDVLFCHDCPASTTRYLLQHDGQEEDQLSSGVWVATAAGSTAAIRAAGGKPMSPRSKRLQFAVREPFPSGGARSQSHPQMTKGFVADRATLSIFSKTEAARLYVDGPHVVFKVSFGDVVRFARSEKPLSIYRPLKRVE
jgi:NAD+ kinase